MADMMTVEDYMKMKVGDLLKDVQMKVPMAIDALRNKFPEMNGKPIQELIKAAEVAVSRGVDNVKDAIVTNEKAARQIGVQNQEPVSAGAKVITMETSPTVIHAVAPDAMAKIPQVQAEVEKAPGANEKSSVITSQQKVDAYKAAVDSGLMARAPFAETAEQKAARAEFSQNFAKNLAEGNIKLALVDAFAENTTGVMMNHSNIVPMQKKQTYSMAA